MPTIADLFCGAGGAARGLQRAGFHVTGFDIAPQPRYVGDEFYQQDALTVDLTPFDAVWASPPCQAYTIAKSWHGHQPHYADLIPVTREMVKNYPHVIENVVGAPLRADYVLCGTMFDMRTYRHRWFEVSFEPLPVIHRKHKPGLTSGRRYSSFLNAEMITVAGHNFSKTEGSVAMGIDWMTRAELAQAVPPAYSEYLGKLLLEIAND